MDSKMDTGYVPADEIESERFDFSETLSVGQVVWIMDELLKQEIAWLDGYPLSQTIFTSVHIDRIIDPSDRYHQSFLGTHDESRRENDTEKKAALSDLLHVFCSAMLKTCSMALDLIRSQTYCEEEDFVTHLFGRELLPDVTNEALLGRIDEALVSLSAIDIHSEDKAALESRLLFRKRYLQSIFGQYYGWQEMVDLLKGTINDTNPFSQRLPNAFTDKIQRTLATSTPPRPKLELSWKDTCQRWITLCEDVVAATQVTSLWVRQSPAGLHRAMSAFASRQASTLPRVILQDIVFVDGKIADDTPHFELVTTDVRDLVLPGDVLLDPASFHVELPSDPRHKSSRVMEAFLDGVLDEFMNTYHILCLNRCRIRRSLTQLIPIFETLEIHSADYDEQLERITATQRLDTALGKGSLLNPLRTWARFYKLKIMSETVLMGFETEIYLPDEIGPMYWYLSLLLQQRQELLSHIRIFTTARQAKLLAQPKSHLLLECVDSLGWYKVIEAELSIFQHLATALWQVFAILKQQGLITTPCRSFATPDLLFEARMKPYLVVKDPAPPSREDFASASITTSDAVDQALASTNTEIKLARKHLNTLKAMTPQSVRCVGSETYWHKEVKQLETTCVALSVLNTQLSNAVKASQGDLNRTHSIVLPPVNKRYHPWWVVPQLKAKE